MIQILNVNIMTLAKMYLPGKILSVYINLQVYSYQPRLLLRQSVTLLKCIVKPHC